MAVKYTDIDYVVFTDGTRFVAEGGTPYDRLTYRYTPLLSYLLLPNIWISSLFGKLLFVACDILVAVLLLKILRLTDSIRSTSSPLHNRWVALGWLLNPVVINVSTRGNAESVICVLVAITLFFLYSPGCLDLCAIFFGVSVHFKIYPIIYAPAFLLFITKRHNTLFHHLSLPRKLLAVVNAATLRFGLVSAGTFLLLTLWMYSLYGFQFLDQTYLYHIYRTDHRHNLSLYFYHLYISSSASAPSSPLIAIGMFLPQLLLLAIVSWAYSDRHSLPVGLLLLTMSFVTFNKVCTVQYFVWYLLLLPLIFPLVRMTAARAALLLCTWLATQMIWLSFGYLLEFQGVNVFLYLWLAGVAFFAANIFVMHSIVSALPRAPTTKP